MTLVWEIASFVGLALAVYTLGMQHGKRIEQRCQEIRERHREK